ncbi:uncharacterized protein UTRI_03486 [Ustilago trichophora]|uniref:Uncharacterized protein n=1 Tax=Ustilago trichophora TaxID=86804 RepID=A0A5C3E162_9BASI|nr:uncharacterized protein UTRI_03486 [Ustilago trichophora]
MNLVPFWKRISNTALGIVTETAAFHWSMEGEAAPPIKEHAAAHAELKSDTAPSSFKLFTFADRTATSAKLQAAIEVFFPPEVTNDFSAAMQASKRHGIFYLVTKQGFFHLYYESGACIYKNRVSGDTIFVIAEQGSTSVVNGINRQVPLALLHRPRGEAAKIDANSPRGVFRSSQTIEQLKQVSNQPGTLCPILQYFGILLEKGSVHRFESLELARPVLNQGRKHSLEEWRKESKIECSENLGALSTSTAWAWHGGRRSESMSSARSLPASLRPGIFDKIVLYAKKVGYTPDYAALLPTQCPHHPGEGPPASCSTPSRITSPSKLTSRHVFLEMNLVNAPQVADSSLGDEVFTHYDRPRIANLCAKALAAA